MYNYTLMQWLFIFFLYSFIGWCYESTYVSINKKHWVNRGFMHGPFLPLYGSGAVMMLVVSKPFSGNLALTFAAGCVGATILELLTGIGMEKLFKFRYWDYTDMPLNYKGYICLPATLVWGLMTIIMTHLIHRPIEHIILSVTPLSLEIYVLLLTSGLSGDFAISFRDAIELRDIMIQISRARLTVSEIQNQMILTMKELSGQVKDKILDEKDTVVSMKRQLSEITAGLLPSRPELIDEWEEKVRGVVDSQDEATSAQFRSGRQKYRSLKEKLTASRASMDNTLTSYNPKRINRLIHYSSVKSSEFAEALQQLRDKFN